MIVRPVYLCIAVLLVSLPGFAQTSPDAQKGSNLAVHLTYTGSGRVDEAHKIYVILWDSPNFTDFARARMRPLAVRPLRSKSATARFEDVSKNPVYVSAAYDPSGTWDASSGAPPVGTSLGLYGKDPRVADPVKLEPGTTTEVSVTLDDSFKKPQMPRKQ